MPSRIEIVPDAPIIIETIEPGEALGNVSGGMRSMSELLDAQPAPVYLVLNLMGLKITLDDLIKTSSQSARGEGALLHHPKIIETLVVISGDTMMMLSAEGLRSSETFGHARIRTFDTVDQALEYCYQKIAEAEQQ